MATLVLTAVGSALGGPLGGAIGSLVGNAIDRDILFRPPGREGPRLNELEVQTSRYGAHIPQLFGTMRVAGQVIWAADLIETPSESGGKGQGTLTSYAYAASFAVLLSARRIVRVGRIWADGSLLRGAAGDFKVETMFRLHTGDERQPPDPLIAAAQGEAGTPAWRGCAYAVFESLPLASFGNRIPSLTFEVVADDGPVPLRAVVTALTGERVRCAASAPVDGYAGHGDTLRAAIEPLHALVPLRYAARVDGLEAVLAEADGAPTIVAAGASGDARRYPRSELSRAPIESVPRRIEIGHYDPARDYQTGAQHAVRDGAGRTTTRIELPAALPAGAARAAAEALLARGLAEREHRTARLPWRPDLPRIGDAVRVDGADGTWRVAQIEIERMAATLSLVRMPSPIAGDPPASSGQAATAPDLPVAPTRLALAEIAPEGASAEMPQLFAIAGGAPGWRGAALSVSADAGSGWTAIGRARAAATIGTVEMPPLADVSPALIDRRSAMVVRIDGNADLADADAAAIDAGANLALAGRELLQFETAEPLGDGRWRLIGLRRGRRGSETAMAGHLPDEAFAIVAPGAIVPIPGAWPVGSSLQALAEGAGDAAPAEAVLAVDGRSIRPLSPVHLRADAVAGGLAVRWIRRSRAAGGWRDGIDAPIAEEAERYRIRIRRHDGAIREDDVAQAAWLYPAAALADDRAVGPVVLEVAQVGTHGLSAPATMLL